MWCVLGNHGLVWNQSILILVQNRQVLIITSRISQPRSPQLVYGLRNCSLNLEFQKMNFFTCSHFLLCWKVYFSPWATDCVKSSSTNYNESNKPNPKSLSYIESKKSFVQLGVLKNVLFHSFHIFAVLKNLLFHPKPWFPKTHHIYVYVCVYFTCKGSTLCMFFTCKERTSDKERTHTRYTVGVDFSFNSSSLKTLESALIWKW